MQASVSNSNNLNAYGHMIIFKFKWTHFYYFLPFIMTLNWNKNPFNLMPRLPPLTADYFNLHVYLLCLKSSGTICAPLSKDCYPEFWASPNNVTKGWAQEHVCGP